MGHAPHMGQVADRARTDLLWRRARAFGVSRRRFLQLLAASGILGVRGPAAEARQAIVKPAPPDRFIRNGSNLEMRWEAMYGRGYLVPNDLFFVRNNSPEVPRLDPATWRLEFAGSGLARPRSFTYDEILGMPSVSVIRAIECAGNGRDFFAIAHGRKIEGTPWRLGGIGVAEWTGVPLRELLARAGVTPRARDVMPEGADSGRIKRPVPIGKAMADDTLIVYAMNGEPLPPDHGYPVRMLVPGWVGISHVKWITRCEVSEGPLVSDYSTNRYVLVGPGYEPQPPAKGPVLTTQKVKSAFELPWDGTIAAGRRLLRGRSWSGEGHIVRVDVSVDGGGSWRPARLREPNIGLAWVRWDLEWDARPGRHQLQARATDSSGNTQPDRVPLNEQGYAYWAVVSHPIRVT